MYSDISTLQDKIDLYYLENGVFPSDGTTITKNSKDCVKDGAINPNDGEDYYLVDISKLEGITLNNSKRCTSCRIRFRKKIYIRFI
jgi:hypothetical protein